ncbi:MAG: hypothetical protein ACI9EW_002255 [Cellvibrionaceae bacterium]|jgi:uncharacterized protein (DUF1501 family)
MTKTIKTHCSGYEKISRRDFLGSGLFGAAGLMLGQTVPQPQFTGSGVTPLPAWAPQITLADQHTGPRGDTLVCVFLRGGADGLNIVVPHGDDAYYDQRPTIAIARPDDVSAGNGNKVVDLNGFFGLHPALAPLHAIYSAGDMAFVQATGSPDETRSHFEAMDLMERGAIADEHSGWLARHLGTLDTGNDSALRAIAIGEILPQSLSGQLSATALSSVADYHLHGRKESAGELAQMLQQIYAEQQNELLRAAAAQTFDALALMRKIGREPQASRGRSYGDSNFGKAMQTVAQLIHAEAGVEVACVDLGGWDTHVAQGGAEGLMARNLATLGQGLAAFYEDLGEKSGSVTVMVMSEFGRRIHENGGAGTDHGHGNMMMLLGGGVNGNQVHARWPGVHPDVQEGPGDLVITTDYRDVLGEALRKRMKNPKLNQVFAGYTVQENELFAG